MQKQLDLPLTKAVLQLWTADEIFANADGATFRALGEDRRVERKLGGIQPRELGTYVAMFANTAPDGGVIVVGMEDDGSMSGCARIGHERLNDLERVGYTYCPDARYDTKRIAATRSADGGEDFLLLFRVYYRQEKVVETTNGDAFIRRGESRTLLKDDEKRELQISKGQVSLEREPCGLSYPDDFDRDLIKTFADNYRMSRGLTGDHDDVDVLVLRHLGKFEGGAFVPNIACALLFARDPAAVIPGCKIRFLRFEGTTERSGSKFNVVKDIWIEGNLPGIIVETEGVVQSQVRDFTRLGTDGKFFTAPEYPKDAWYEAVVNACVHRSYGLKNMNIFVKMFDDRLEVESPGGFPPLVTPQNIYDSHQPRNPFLMEALYYLNFVKCAHEGTRRIRDTMLKMNLPAPEFAQKEMEGSRVLVTMRNDVAHRKAFVDSDAAKMIGEDVFRGLDDEERLIINYAAERESMNITDAQRVIGRTWAFARKKLIGLVKKGVLKYEKRPHLVRDTKARFMLKVKHLPSR